MKKIFLGTLVAAVILVNITSAMAEHICVAKVQDIFENSALGKDKVTADEKKLKPKIDKLKENIIALQTTLTSYEEEKNGISSDVTKDKSNDTQSNNKEKSLDKNQVQADLEKAMKEYQYLIDRVQALSSDNANFFKRALTAVSKQIAQTKHCDIVLPTEMTLFTTDSQDITKDIVASMNRNMLNK